MVQVRVTLAPTQVGAGSHCLQRRSARIGPPGDRPKCYPKPGVFEPCPPYRVVWSFIFAEIRTDSCAGGNYKEESPKSENCGHGHGTVGHASSAHPQASCRSLLVGTSRL